MTSPVFNFALQLLRGVTVLAIFYYGGRGSLQLIRMGYWPLFLLSGVGTLVAMAIAGSLPKTSEEDSDDVR